MVSNDGGSAFPGANPKEFPGISGGMTLRDYFAAAAMQGILGRETVNLAASNFHPIAQNAYQIADVFIAERSRTDAAQSGQ